MIRPGDLLALFPMFLGQLLLDGIQCLERNEQDPVNSQFMVEPNNKVAHTRTT